MTLHEAPKGSLLKSTTTLKDCIIYYTKTQLVIAKQLNNKKGTENTKMSKRKRRRRTEIHNMEMIVFGPKKIGFYVQILKILTL